MDSWHDPEGPLTNGDLLPLVEQNLRAWVSEARSAMNRTVIVEAAEAGGLSDEAIAKLLAEWT